MVTFFPQWLSQLTLALRGTYTDASLAMVTAQLLRKHAHAFSPDGKHKRSVLPGRFADELAPETIARMHREHRSWWAELGYI